MTNRPLTLLAAAVLLIQSAKPLPPSPAPQSTPTIASKIVCSHNSIIPLKDRTPELCIETELARHGIPIMFPLRNGVAYGASLNPGKLTAISIWMDNQTDQTQDYYMCCNLTFSQRIDLYDANGHRIPSKADIEAEKHRLADDEMGWGCGCSAWFKIQPHTLQVVDFGDLSITYSLASGKYSLSERPPRDPNAANLPAESRPSHTADRPQIGPSLAISIP